MFCSANLSIHHAVGVLATGRRTARTSRVLQVSVVPWLCKVRVLWEEEHEGGRDIVKHIIKLKVTCTLKSALHSCRLSTRCQSGSGSPQALTKKRKIPSEMEVAPHYTPQGNLQLDLEATQTDLEATPTIEPRGNPRWDLVQTARLSQYL